MIIAFELLFSIKGVGVGDQGEGKGERDREVVVVAGVIPILLVVRVGGRD